VGNMIHSGDPLKTPCNACLDLDIRGFKFNASPYFV